MNDNLPLFSQPRPLSRASDPATSRSAANSAATKAKSDRERCLAVVLAHPEGLTSEEIAREAGMDRHAAARRMPELEAVALVERGPVRRSVGGRDGVTWRAVGNLFRTA